MVWCGWLGGGDWKWNKQLQNDARKKSYSIGTKHWKSWAIWMTPLQVADVDTSTQIMCGQVREVKRCVSSQNRMLAPGTHNRMLTHCKHTHTHTLQVENLPTGQRTYSFQAISSYFVPSPAPVNQRCFSACTKNVKQQKSRTVFANLRLQKSFPRTWLGAIWVRTGAWLDLHKDFTGSLVKHFVVLIFPICTHSNLRKRNMRKRRDGSYHQISRTHTRMGKDIGRGGSQRILGNEIKNSQK